MLTILLCAYTALAQGDAELPESCKHNMAGQACKKCVDTGILGTVCYRGVCTTRFVSPKRVNEALRVWRWPMFIVM